MQIRVELKVCEGCGALWLRGANHGVYCGRCAAMLADFPPVRGKNRRALRPAENRPVVKRRLGCVAVGGAR